MIIAELEGGPFAGHVLTLDRAVPSYNLPVPADRHLWMTGGTSEPGIPRTATYFKSYCQCLDLAGTRVFTYTYGGKL